MTLSRGLVTTVRRCKANMLGLILLILTCLSVREVESRFVQCPKYCDRYGNLRSMYCHVRDRPVYCCGEERTRYCCYNRSQDISGIYPSLDECQQTPWFVTHWQTITGLMVTLILLLFCAATCYYCCGVDGRPTRYLRNRANRRRASNMASNSVSHQVDNGGGGSSTDLPTFMTFDPASPHAFEPPPYESLPKEPPKYAEIFETGTTNLAFEGDGSAGFSEESRPSASASVPDSSTAQGETTKLSTQPAQVNATGNSSTSQTGVPSTCEAAQQALPRSENDCSQSNTASSNQNAPNEDSTGQDDTNVPVTNHNLTEAAEGNVAAAITSHNVSATLTSSANQRQDDNAVSASLLANQNKGEDAVSASLLANKNKDDTSSKSKES